MNPENLAICRERERLSQGECLRERLSHNQFTGGFYRAQERNNIDNSRDSVFTGLEFNIGLINHLESEPQ